MDEFLKVVYNEHIAKPEIGNKTYDDFFKPFLDRLQEIVSPKLYEELESLFTGCSIENTMYYGVEGMKLAIGIMDGTYIPTV